MRLGISDRKIEIKKLKKTVSDIKQICDEPVEIIYLPDKTNAAGEAIRLRRFKNEIDKAFQNNEIDMAVVSMVDLLRINEHGNTFESDIKISGILKRRDPRYVLVTKKRRNDSLPGAVILTDSTRNVERLYRLYDNIFPEVERSYSKCFEKLTAGQCDAVFINADDYKAVTKMKGLSYDLKYISCRESVPVHGQGIYGVLTAGTGKYQETALNLSDSVTSIEFDIEEDIIGRAMEYEYVNRIDCYARIKDNELFVYANAVNDKGQFRYTCRDEYANRNLVVRKVVDRIKENM